MKLSEVYKTTKLDRYSDYVSFGKKIEKEVDVEELNIDNYLNVAMLASSTINGIKDVLIAQCSFSDVFVNVYEAKYGQYAQDIFDIESQFYASNPELVIINIDIKSIAADYFFIPYDKSFEERKKWSIEIVNFLSNLVDKVSNHIGTNKILLHNLEVPSYSPFGIIENKEKYGYIESIEEINRALKDRYKNNNQVYLYDYDAFCSKWGKYNIYDAKMYYMGDIKLKPQYIPALCEEYAKYIQAIALRTRKCIVLDLDNTLWGGVVGECGIDGINLGPTPEGKPFLEFQKYLYALYSRGVILAINSKNNFDDAMEVIRKHPHMILREECFAAVRINWKDKVSNIKSLAEEINIGLDSLVFFDDDKINQEMVKKFLPEVAVIELSKDASLYVDTIKKMSFFDTLKITSEDKIKGKMYQAEKQRRGLKQSTTDLTDYLRMLDITAYIEDANHKIIPRISQLTQKTNQFNMTSKRYPEEKIAVFSKSDKFRVISVTLKDKFGDYGLTGVAIVKKNIEQCNWEIDSFLLSCRILGRRVEDLFLSYILQEAKLDDVRFVIGKFIASEKNIPAKDFYKNNGFIMINKVRGVENWEFDMKNKFFFPDFIDYKVLHEVKNV